MSSLRSPQLGLISSYGQSLKLLGLLVIGPLLSGCGGGASSAPSMATRQTTQTLPASISPGLFHPGPMAHTAILPASAMQFAKRVPMMIIQGLSYTQISGSASSAAAAPDGSLWVLSTGSGDRYIWHYSNGSWTNISGLASRLSVAPSGTLYAVSSSGGVYSYSGGTWTTLGGGSSDVGVAADGSFYVLSNGNPIGSDQAVWHYTNSWTQVAGAGVRIAASWDTNSYSLSGGTVAAGGLYILNAAGNIYHENTDNSIVQLPGSASDIAPTTIGGILVLGYPFNSSNNSIYYYNLNTPGWTTQGGTGTSISSNTGELYVVDASGAIYASQVAPSQSQFQVGIWPPSGYAPFASTSPFNQRVPASPAYLSNSQAVVTYIFSYPTNPFIPIRVAVNPKTVSQDTGYPYYFASASDPVYTISCNDYGGNCGNKGVQVHIPVGAYPEVASDGHMAILDESSGTEYDFWQAQTPSGSGGNLAISWGDHGPLNGPGFAIDSSSSDGFGATRSGFALTLGIIRASDLMAGTINHALTFAPYCATTAVHPLAGMSGSIFACSSGVAGPPYGGRLWLDLSYNDIENLTQGGQPAPTYVKAVYHALANYGAFVGDTVGLTENDFIHEGAQTYTYAGYTNPWVTLANQYGITADGNGLLNFSLSVDNLNYTQHFHFLAPCVTVPAC